MMDTGLPPAQQFGSTKRAGLLFHATVSALISFDFFFGISQGVGSVLASVLIVVKYNSRVVAAVARSGWMVLTWLLMVSYVFAGVIIARGDISFLLTTTKVGLVVVSYACYLRFSREDNDTEVVFRAVTLVWGLQMLYVVACLVSPDLTVLGQFFRPPLSNRIYSNIGTEGTFARLYPASGQLISGLAAVSGAVFAYSLWYGTNSSQPAWLKGMSLISIAIVGIISGRTFLVMAAIAMMMLLLLSPRHFFRYLLLIVLFLAIAFFALEQTSPRLAEWVFEPVLNLLISGSLSTRSTDDLLNNHLHTILPLDVVFPSFAYKNQGGWAAGSDSGFVRYAYFGGYQFVILQALTFLTTASFAAGKLVQPSMILSVVLLLAVTVKQETLTNASLFCTLLLVLLAGRKNAST